MQDDAISEPGTRVRQAIEIAGTPMSTPGDGPTVQPDRTPGAPVPQATGQGDSASVRDLERTLVERAAEGDQVAFRALYDRSVARVHALLLRLNSNRARAEDLTQETYIRAWKGLPKFRGDASFSSWLHRIAVRVSIEAHRRRRLREEKEVDWPETEGGAGVTRPYPTVARVSLERAIATLPEGAKTVFVLHEIEGFSHAEIAEMSGAANATIRSQLHRGPQTTAQGNRAMTDKDWKEAEDLREALSSLPREIPPARDLWVGIEREIEGRDTGGSSDRGSWSGIRGPIAWLGLGAAALLAGLWVGGSGILPFGPATSGPAAPDATPTAFTSGLLDAHRTGLSEARQALEGSPVDGAIAPSFAVLDSLVSVTNARLEAAPRDPTHARELAELERRRASAASQALRVMFTTGR